MTLDEANSFVDGMIRDFARTVARSGGRAAMCCVTDDYVEAVRVLQSAVRNRCVLEERVDGVVGRIEAPTVDELLKILREREKADDTVEIVPLTTG